MKYLNKISDNEETKRTSMGTVDGGDGDRVGAVHHDTPTLPNLVYNPVLRIHKAWRHYKEYRLSTSTTTNNPDIITTPFNTTTTRQQQPCLDNHLYCNTTTNNTTNNYQDITNNNANYYSSDDMTNYNNNNFNNFKLTHSLVESDPNSISSDHSELNDSFRDQLVGLHLDKDSSLSNKQFNDQFNQSLTTSSSPLIQPNPNLHDDDLDTQKHIRKTNLLNIAHEFAALKKVNTQALPFNIHSDIYGEEYSYSDNDEIMLPCDGSKERHIGSDAKVFSNDINNNNDYDVNFEERQGRGEEVLEKEGSQGINSSNLDDVEHHDDEIQKKDEKDGGGDGGGGCGERVFDVCGLEGVDVAGCEREGCSDGINCNDDDEEEDVMGRNANVSNNVEEVIKNNGNDINKNTPNHNDNKIIYNGNNDDSVKMIKGGDDDDDVITITARDSGVSLRHKPCMSRSISNRHIRNAHDVDDDHKNKIWHRLSTREEILKKLAFQEDEDLDLTLKPLCYVNEAAHEIEKEKFEAGGFGSSGGEGGGGCGGEDAARNNDTGVYCAVDVRGVSNGAKYNETRGINPAPTCKRAFSTPDEKQKSKATPDIITSTIEAIQPAKKEDFISRQTRLKTEAKMALAQARPMAYMQLQLEKKKATKSPLADITGMSEFVEGQLCRLSPNILHQMNLAQLQVLLNELHARIEVLNSDLMEQLVSRDDLHTMQDSMLVDIEDVTGRAQEFGAKVNKKKDCNSFL